MALQVLVKEFVGYSALFLRTIEGKPTCPPIPQTRSIGKSLGTMWVKAAYIGGKGERGGQINGVAGGLY